MKIEPYTLRVGVSYRSKALIQPYLSRQWFFRLTRFKEQLLSAVREKRVALIPPHWQQTYEHWIENLRDWCISRQLWWGHRIPIWYDKENPEKMICYDGEGVPPKALKEPRPLGTGPGRPRHLVFIRSLAASASLAGPKRRADLKKFYPTSTLDHRPRHSLFLGRPHDPHGRISS